MKKIILGLLVSFVLLNSYAQTIPNSIRALGGGYEAIYVDIYNNSVETGRTLINSGKYNDVNTLVAKADKNNTLKNVPDFKDNFVNFLNGILSKGHQPLSLSSNALSSEGNKVLASINSYVNNNEDLSGLDSYMTTVSTTLKSSKTIRAEEKQFLALYITTTMVHYNFAQTLVASGYYSPTGFWQGVKCAFGTIGGAVLGGLAGAAVGTVTLPVIGTVSGTVVGFYGGAMSGAAASCF